MRIAFINTCRGWGGAEEQMLAMTRELEKRGHTVAVFVRLGGPTQARFVAGGHRVLPVVRKGMSALFAPFRAAAKARAERFDVVHSHRDHDLPLGKLLALACGAPLLLTQHCLPNKPSGTAYRLADRVVAVSRYIAAGIAAKLPAVAARIGAIPNGIDSALFADPDPQFWRRHPLVGRRGPLLGVVGDFYKGQEELIGLLPTLLKEFPQLALILVGEDETRRPSLQELAQRTGVADAVVFAGRIPRELMKDALAGLDLNVSAFRNEGFGLSVLEGLAVGTPFVGYRAGGYPEIVADGETGRLVERPPELTGAIAGLLGDQPSAKAARSDACRKVAQAFGLAGMVEAYEAVYRHITERP